MIILTVAATCLTLSFSSNFTGFSICLAKYGIVQPDLFHPSFVIDGIMPIRRSKQHFNVSFKMYSGGNTQSYTINCLLMTDLLFIMKRLLLPLTQPVDFAIPSGYIKNLNTILGYMAN
jgi:hypothetical protein